MKDAASNDSVGSAIALQLRSTMTAEQVEWHNDLQRSLIALGLIRASVSDNIELEKVLRDVRDSTPIPVDHGDGRLYDEQVKYFFGLTGIFDHGRAISAKNSAILQFSFLTAIEDLCHTVEAHRCDLSPYVDEQSLGLAKQAYEEAIPN